MTWPGLAARLEGKIVVLEPLAREHEDALFEAANHPDIWRWMDANAVATRETFHDYVEQALANADAGIEAPFATLDAATGTPIGSTRYTTLRAEHRGLEIGYTWHSPQVWGKGVNVEAKYLLLRHAFEDVGCMRVEFKTDARNERARAALEALPARFEGIFLKHMLVRDGVVRDSAWYAITDAEWPAVRANLERRISEKR
jgi:RimJ/RimL family protein N-acetyltransferase